MNAIKMMGLALMASALAVPVMAGQNDVACRRGQGGHHPHTR